MMTHKNDIPWVDHRVASRSRTSSAYPVGGTPFSGQVHRLSEHAPDLERQKRLLERLACKQRRDNSSNVRDFVHRDANNTIFLIAYTQQTSTICKALARKLTLLSLRFIKL
jgi:hypothetical protein